MVVPIQDEIIHFLQGRHGGRLGIGGIKELCDAFCNPGKIGAFHRQHGLKPLPFLIPQIGDRIQDFGGRANGCDLGQHFVDCLTQIRILVQAI